MSEVSNPSKYSSTSKTWSPKILFSKTFFAPFSISTSSDTIKTPLPAASPSAFKTTKFCSDSSLSSFAYLIASPASLKDLYFAVGIFLLANIVLQNSFDPSICEASFEGANINFPALSNTSAMPSTSGASGPTIV